jgi:hypothetical protein
MAVWTDDGKFKEIKGHIEYIHVLAAYFLTSLILDVLKQQLM